MLDYMLLETKLHCNCQDIKSASLSQYQTEKERWGVIYGAIGEGIML